MTYFISPDQSPDDIWASDSSELSAPIKTNSQSLIAIERPNMKPPAFRLLITGSRSWTHKEPMEALLSKIYKKVSKAPWSDEPVMVHGTAIGADQMASHIWLELGGAVEAHPAHWDQHTDKCTHSHKLTTCSHAGYRRNDEMVAAGADLCIAFIHNRSRGATQCSHAAEQAGIKTWRITAND